MSIIQAPHGIQYSGKEAMDYILKPSVNVGKLKDFFKIKTGLKTKEQVIFIAPIKKITRKDSGCSPTYNDKQPARTEKFWNPENVEAALTQCYTDLYGSLHEQQLKDGNGKPEISGTAIEKMLLDLIIPAAEEDRMRMAWMSKKSITAAELTNGAADVENYNQLDGMWKRLFDGVGASLIPRHTITTNAGTTAAAQVLAAGDGKKILAGVWKKQGLVMKQAPKTNKVFFVTREIYDNYYDELESNNTLESARVMLINGEESLSYRGVPLVVVDAWDTAIQSDFLVGGKYDLPNRVVLTLKENLQIGLDINPDAPLAFDAWDEKKDKKWYARLLYRIDSQIAMEEYVVVGY